MTPRALDAVGVALLCAAGLLAGILETLLTPLYIGSVLAPFAVAAAIASNIVLPVLARRLIDTTLAGALPFLAWLAAVIVLGLVPRPEGDVLLPGGGTQQYVSLGMVICGAAAGAVTLGLLGGRLRRR